MGMNAPGQAPFEEGSLDFGKEAPHDVEGLKAQGFFETRVFQDAEQAVRDLYAEELDTAGRDYRFSVNPETEAITFFEKQV